MTSPKRIFISYFQEDCMPQATLLAKSLKLEVGVEVFRDIDATEPGALFDETYVRALSSCDGVIALIGNDWRTLPGRDGKPKIEDLDGHVHREIAAALERNVPILPVLVEGAELDPDDLPAPIEKLGRRFAASLSDRDWDREFEDVKRWVESVKNPQEAAPHLQSEAGSTERLPQKRNDGLAVAGYISGLLIPLVGAIIGFVLRSRKDSRSTGVFIISGVGLIVWWSLITAAGQ